MISEFFSLQKSIVFRSTRGGKKIEKLCCLVNCFSSIDKSSPRFTVAVKFTLVLSTHISCVAVRAVSFGASASFGNLRLSVRPPVLFALAAISWSPKKSQAVENTEGILEISSPRTTVWDSPPPFPSQHLRLSNRHVS